MRNFLKILVVLLILTACGKQPPKTLIPEDRLVPMIVDFHLILSMQQSPDFRVLTQDYDSIDAYSRIFEKHGYSQAEFDSTIAWYTQNTGLFLEIYDEVIMQLSRINDSIETVLMGQ